MNSKLEEQILSLPLRDKAHVLHLFARELGGVVGIEVDADVCGGEARIVRSRIPVWMLERMRQLGVSESDILRSYPALRAEDLVNAWSYVQSHLDEIAHEIAANEE